MGHILNDLFNPYAEVNKRRSGIPVLDERTVRMLRDLLHLTIIHPEFRTGLSTKQWRIIKYWYFDHESRICNIYTLLDLAFVTKVKADDGERFLPLPFRRRRIFYIDRASIKYLPPPGEFIELLKTCQELRTLVTWARDPSRKEPI